MYILPASSGGVTARVLSLNAVIFCTFSRTSLMIILGVFSRFVLAPAAHGYTAPLPQIGGFAMKQLDRVRTSFAGAKKQLHLLFVKLVRLPNESPGPVHRAVQRRLVPDDGIFLTSYTLVVGSHAVDSTTNGYFMPFSSGGLPQPWNTLPFPMVAGESLICPSDCIVRLPGKRSGMYEPLVLIVMDFGTHRVNHRAGYPVLPPLDCTMAPPPDNLGQVGPCTGCNKKQSGSKRSPCTLCQEKLVCRSCSQAGTCCGACRTNPGWHLEFKAKTVTDTPSVPGTASFFMLCDENTHLYLTVVDMPRAVTEVRSMGDAAPSPEHCPLRQFCHGNSIISTGTDTVLATVHFPRVWVSFFATYSLGASLFGLCLIRSSQPHAVVLCVARLFPRKPISWIIEWRGTTAGSPHGTNNPQGFPRL